MKSLAKRLTFKKKGKGTTTRASNAMVLAPDADQAMWGLSVEQEGALLQQLRDEVELEVGELAVEWEDCVLRRFLRARKHNILHAKLMFLEQLKWRKDSGVDTVLTDFHFHEREEFAKWYPEAFYGVDRVGRPVYVQQPGKIDMAQLWKFTTMERCVRYHLQQQERYWRIIAPSCSLAAGRLHEQSLVIIDMEGVGISTLTGEVRSMMGEIMRLDQDFYPELMNKCVIINAPTTFRVIWGMVRYLLDSRTQQKIEVLGVDYQAELLRLIAPEQLLECYGGSNLTPMSSEPGPWQNVELLAALQQQRKQRLVDTSRRSSMTYPPVPGAETTGPDADGAAPATVPAS